MRIGSAAALLACLAFGLAGCASGPDIRVDSDPSVRVADYRTFAYFSPLATDKAGYSTLITSHLKDATRREMEKRGYVYEESNPDLLLNFQVQVENRSEVRSSPSMGVGYGGYYGYRSYGAWASYPVDVQTVNYKQGTLGIDVVDAKRRALVWHAVAEGRIKKASLENPGPAIDAAVPQVMADFPSRLAAPAAQ